MAIELECGICGQEHRFREEHSGRATKCKECATRIDIPRGGIGGILDGTTPVWTPPVILVCCGVMLAAGIIGVVELRGRLRSTDQPVATITPTPVAPEPFRSSTSAVPPPVVKSPSAVETTPVPPVPFPTQADRNRASRSNAAPANRSNNADAMVRLRELYRRRQLELVSLDMPADQPVQIHNLTPTWAEPGSEVRITGKGLSEVTRVVAVDSSFRFQEHELRFQILMDSEISVSAPPAMPNRDECYFVFELHGPRGVAVTFPKELVDCGTNHVFHEFGIVRRGKTEHVVQSFVLLDDVGSIERISTTRVYALNPTNPQDFLGAQSRIFVTPNMTLGKVVGADLKAIETRQVFPCFIGQMFVGPNCRQERLRLMREQP